MTEHECKQCTFYFKRMERLDPGISVSSKGCVRDIEDPDDCHEFQEKWYAGNDDGFQDSMEEQSDFGDGFMEHYLTPAEYKDWVETNEKLAVLKHELKIEQDKKSG